MAFTEGGLHMSVGVQPRGQQRVHYAVGICTQVRIENANVLVSQVAHAVRKSITVDAARHEDVETDSLVIVPAGPTADFA